MPYVKVILAVVWLVAAVELGKLGLADFLQWKTLLVTASKGVMIGLPVIGLVWVIRRLLPKDRLKRTSALVLDGDLESARALCEKSLQQFNRRAYVLKKRSRDATDVIRAEYYSYRTGTAKIIFKLREDGVNEVRVDLLVSTNQILPLYDNGVHEKVMNGLESFFANHGGRIATA